MRKLLALTALFCLSAFVINAQIETPQPSPAAKLEQKVGLTDISIEYSRPGVKARTIFGDLVPYGTMWRTGANKSTMITFSTDVKVNGADLKKGTYALFTVPGATSWDFIFYTDTENWGTPENFDEEKVAARVQATPQAMPMSVETMLFNIGDVKGDSAELELIWATTYVGVTIEVPTDDMVMSKIDKVMAGPAHGDYYSAAVYYKEAGKDLGQALSWIDKSIELRGEEKFWVLRQKSEIQAAMKDYKGAIATAKKSKELAIAADYKPYIKINDKNIAKWSAM